VFNAHLYINESTDIKKTLEKFKKKLTTSNLTPEDIELLLNQLKTILNNFLERGGGLISKGSNFYSSHVVETSKYKIKVTADFVTGSRSFISRILNKLRSF